VYGPFLTEHVAWLNTLRASSSTQKTKHESLTDTNDEMISVGWQHSLLLDGFLVSKFQMTMLSDKYWGESG
jgi:hypothetical protein